jgi:hypothetical protein
MKSFLKLKSPRVALACPFTRKELNLIYCCVDLYVQGSSSVKHSCLQIITAAKSSIENPVRYSKKGAPQYFKLVGIPAPEFHLIILGLLILLHSCPSDYFGFMFELDRPLDETVNTLLEKLLLHSHAYL